MNRREFIGLSISAAGLLSATIHPAGSAQEEKFLIHKLHAKFKNIVHIDEIVWKDKRLGKS